MQVFLRTEQKRGASGWMRPVPGTKVCAVRSGERFAEAVQHRGKLGARGRGLRRDGIAADAEDQLMRDRPLHRADRKSADAALIGKARQVCRFVTS